MLLSTPGAAGDLAMHPLPSESDYANAILSTLDEQLEVDEPPLLQFESGGGVISSAVVMLTAVSEVKDVRTDPPRRFVSVDGSMMMFVSRGMMRVGHPVLAAIEPFRATEAVAVELCGQTCVYDSIAEDIKLPAVVRRRRPRPAQPGCLLRNRVDPVRRLPATRGRALGPGSIGGDQASRDAAGHRRPRRDPRGAMDAGLTRSLNEAVDGSCGRTPGRDRGSGPDPERDAELSRPRPLRARWRRGSCKCATG